MRITEAIQSIADAATDWSLLDVNAAPDIHSYREAIKQLDESLKQAFLAGEDTPTLVNSRAVIIDRVLITAWHAHTLDQEKDIALIAVGGYGRGELHPRSDIDLMLLVTTTDVASNENLSAFITFLWDIGLQVGHSVRTLDDSVEQAKLDVTVATNLMEARLLIGSQPLFDAMMERTGPEHIWPSRDFFSAKLQEQIQRHHKYGDTAYKLEPNIKESAGGLRDIQMVDWVAKRHFGASHLHQLVEHNFLTEEEYQALKEGQRCLWRIRFALHVLTGRSEDRLLFDHQRELARQFGYTDQEHNLAVEQFMQAYYRAVMELERLNEMLLQLYDEAILQGDNRSEPIAINRRFQINNGYLEVTNDKVFEHYPSALLEAFLLVQQHTSTVKGIRASTIRLIREYRHLIDDEFRSNIVNRSLFMEILRQPHGITHEFRRMNRYGILAAYWPSFARIVGRMQYDLFHAYTVDEHTLFVLRNVRRMALPEHADELPLCYQLFSQIAKPELLYLAALFHDIGKGRGGDHSEIGEKEAETFCLEHGLSSYDARLVAWIVKNHLLMSLTSQRKDISDPEEIKAFAEKAGSIQRLDYLYLLTVADIRGTNPTLWNNWKDSLLRELYTSTKRTLERGLDQPVAREELVNEVQQSALEILDTKGLDLQRCQRLWQGFDEDYFLRHSDDEITWHTETILQFNPAHKPVVQIRQHTARGSTEIFICAHAHHHLFAHITSALSQMGLNILDARITTTSTGLTLDTFLVLNDAGKPITDGFRIDEITDTLQHVLQHPYEPPIEVQRHVSSKLRHFDIPTRIDFDNNSQSRHTLLKLITADHPGLLSNVTKALLETGALVHSARIATIGAQAEDVFSITDLFHQPITDENELERIKGSLLQALGELSDTSIADSYQI